MASPKGRSDVTTMVNVAALAGVSVSTVSHVLNGTRHVEQETRQRVLDAIQQTSYRQDALARALRRSRTDSIGLVVSDAGEPAFAEMMHGVERASAELGLTLLLANSAESSETEARAVRTLLERRVDGLILARAAESTPDVLEQIGRDKAQLVLLDRTFDLPFDQVAAQNHEPMHELVSYLVGHGHRRMAIVAGDIRVKTLAERLDGFRDAVIDAGLDLADQLIIAEKVDRPSSRDVSDRVVHAIGEGHAPTAVIACSTVLAAGALDALRRLGMRTPQDVAFATFDGFSHSDLFEPQLTTVRQPAFEVGVTAVRLLSERLQGTDVEPRTVRLPQAIEYRSSTEDYRFG